VEGHTDNMPISNERFPSNWELSSARASNVVQYMISQGIDPMSIKASAYAETRPEAPNEDAKGIAIPKNQAANRRIVVRIYY
jgi:chemotaxis protein MotB